MDEQFTENAVQTENVPYAPEELILTDAVSFEENTDARKPKRKLAKKTLIILGALLLAVAIAASAFLHKSKFQKVKDECLTIAGGLSYGDGYFTINTCSDIAPEFLTPERALEAIKYANEALGFNGSVYSQMMKTTALMGRQSVENNKYRVSWTYHPDDGLEVTYEKK